MAKNREPEKTVESSESHEEEDDDASSEEVGSHESDSEPEQTQVTKKPSSSTPAATLKKAQPPSSSKPQKQLPASSSSGEDESGSESDSDSDGPDPKVKPLATKPMDSSQKSNAAARKPGSKSAASDLVTPAKSAAAKRPAEEKETETKDSKKAKKKAAEPESSAKKSTDDSKKQLFQRLWSEDDEIAILKGMTDYTLKKNSDPLANMNGFHDFIKKNLHVDVTRTQLSDKVRRLKKKYVNNKKKEKGGKDRSFSNPHEQKAYELSKKVWGNDTAKENGVEKIVTSPTPTPKANGTAAKKTPAAAAKAAIVAKAEEEAVVAVKKDVQSLSPPAALYADGGSVESNILRTGEVMFASGKWTDKEKEWNRLKLEEVAIIQRHLEIKTAQVKLVLDGLKSDE
ncbi:hypothetical protein ABFS83_13G118300 [Erythranthe nasuta]